VAELLPDLQTSSYHTRSLITTAQTVDRVSQYTACKRNDRSQQYN